MRHCKLLLRVPTYILPYLEGKYLGILCSYLCNFINSARDLVVSKLTYTHIHRLNIQVCVGTYLINKSCVKKLWPRKT